MASSSRLTATAREFTPSSKMSGKILDSSFVSQTLPDIPASAGIVGLCAVPQGRAGVDDLGWHIADYLAFKSLLCGQNAPKSQTWLAQCDIASLVKDHPKYYVHGKDRRVVGGAAMPLTYVKDGNAVDREDNIQVEPLDEQLRAKFIEAIKEKVNIAKKYGYPLVIIVCGLTSTEQDVFFVQTHGGSCLTSGDIRGVIGDGVDVTFITPALFSAGWQINPSFCSAETKGVRADRTHFLAKQFGGIFAKNIVGKFMGWECPMLDGTQLDRGLRAHERFPGPAMPAEQQQWFIDTLKVNIHSFLAGRCSLHYLDHSLHFDKESDEWEHLIRPRKGKPLEEYKKKWESLESALVSGHEEGLPFLGNAFGGTRLSQISHIKHLIQESFGAWPGFWALSFGQKVMVEFIQFVNTPAPDDLTCHEFFNILEHRATLNVLADMLVQYLNLPMPSKVRCRDWNQLDHQSKQSSEQQSSSLRLYQEFSAIIPSANIPPGRNPNRYSTIQTRLDVAIFYLNAALGDRFASAPEQMHEAANEIKNLFKMIQVHQAKMLTENRNLREMCIDWLRSIGMPVRSQYPNINWQEFSAVKVVPRIDDEYNEYEVVVAERSSPKEITQVKGAGNTRDGSRSIQHASASPGQHREPIVSPGVHVTGEIDHRAETSIPENIDDDIKLLGDEKNDLIERLTSTDDDKTHHMIIQRLKDVKNQLRDLIEIKENIARGGTTHASNAKASNMRSQPSSTTPRGGESTIKATSVNQSDNRVENSRPPPSPMTPHEPGEVTKGLENLKVQVDMRPQATAQTSPDQSLRGSSTGQRRDAEKMAVMGQGHAEEERTRPDTAPRAFDYHNVKW
ncbi:hypothetical protein F4809DRAFT_646932 [Biscogniauxia mediterranea]|nr:hypothetical protein F4809DRAFT_646932 [Biscogniauxia mediterranea]